jgi:NADPH:quinone reductase-like Zn-dependent oxidoreductase
MVGNELTLEDFSPMGSIPSCVNLTGGPEEFIKTPLEEIIRQVKDGTMKIKIGKLFKADEMVDAHKAMEGNKAGGNIVVLT